MTRLLALDLASTTGWALFENGAPVSYGQVDGHSDSESSYPYDILDKATRAALRVLELVQELHPEVIVIEDTNIGGRAGQSSQRFLEWLHCVLLGELKEKRLQTSIHYIKSSEWRRAINLGLTAADRANNKALATLRRKLKTTLKRKPTPKELAEAKTAAGIAGKRTIKHASVDWANARFGLNLKKTQADAADALCIGAGYLILNRSK